MAFIKFAASSPSRGVKFLSAFSDGRGGDEKNTAVCDPHSLFALVSQSALLGGQERERGLHSNWHRIPGKFHPPFVATPNSVHIKIAGRGEAWRMCQSTNADYFYDAVEPPLRQYSWQDENFIRQKKTATKARLHIRSP